MKRLFLILAALCLAALLARVALDSGAEVAVLRDDVVPAPGSAPKVVDAVSDVLAAPGAEPERRASAAGSGRAGAPALFASRANHPWTSLLGAVTGRVVDAEGTPLPGRRVRLSELVDHQREMGGRHPFGDQSLVVGEDTTGATGEYTIHGALPDRLHLVSVDPLGATAISRFLYQNLEPGGTTKIGDLVVQAQSRVTGRVIGPDGEPLVGAKVELLEDSEELPCAVYGITPREAGAYGILVPDLDRYESDEVTALPAFRYFGGRYLDAYQQWTRSTVFTGDDGRFAIESGLRGSLRAFVSFQALSHALSEPIEGAPDGIDLGDVQLGRHGRLLGLVIDADGAAVEGAEVRAAPLNMSVGFLGGPPTSSAADGSFRVESAGFQDEDLSAGFLVAARRSPSDLWSGVTVQDENQTATIRLRERRSLRLSFRSHGGELETDLVPRLIFLGEGDDSMATSVGPGNPWGKGHFEGPDVDGVFLFPDVELCQWGVRFQVGDGPTWTLPLALPSGDGDDVVTVEIPGAVKVPIDVVQRADGTPVERARVTTTVLGGEMDGWTPLHSASVYTDAAGRAHVWAAVTGEEGDAGGTEMTVDHPRFGTRVEALEPSNDASQGAPVERPVTVLLGGAGTIQGRVTWGGAAPDQGILVAVFNENWVGAPRARITDKTGSFRFEGLAPGEFTVLARERSNEGWLRFNPEEFYEPDSRSAARNVEIKADETQTVLFDFERDGATRPAALTGRVTVNGEVPLSGRIRLDSWEEPRFVPLDAAGRFELYCDVDDYVIGVFSVQNPLSAAPVELTLYLDDYLDEADLKSPTSTGKQPAPKEFDLEVVFVEVTVHAGPSGAQPVKGASCTLDLTELTQGEAKTDGDGRLLLAGLFEGPQAIGVYCSADGYPETSAAVECGATDRYLRLDLELRPPVPCAGRCEGAVNTLGDPKEATFYVYDVWEDLVLEAPMGDDQRFLFEGLGPGSYDVVLSDGEVILDAPMQLTPEGGNDLTLRFSVR